MPLAETPLILLLIFLTVSAIIVEQVSKDMLTVVISFGAVDFGLATAFMILAAPDVAITQLVVGVVALVFLIRATLSTKHDMAVGDHDPFVVSTGFVLVLIMLVISVGVLVQPGMPHFAKPVMERLGNTPAQYYLAKGLTETGAANAVTAVLLDFRGYDTLGEATVLFAAIVGATALLRREARREPGR